MPASITELNTPITSPDTFPAIGYHYRWISHTITAGNILIVYVPYQVTERGFSVIFSDAVNTQLDVSLTDPDVIHAAPSTAGVWATNVNSTHAVWFQSYGPVQALRFTNGGGSTVTVEAIIG